MTTSIFFFKYHIFSNYKVGFESMKVTLNLRHSYEDLWSEAWDSLLLNEAFRRQSPVETSEELNGKNSEKTR